MSKRKPYKRYSPEFKREALKRASDAGGMASASVAWLQAYAALKNSKATFLDTIPLFNGDVWVLAMSIVLVLGMLISLYFMWDVRRPKTE